MAASRHEHLTASPAFGRLRAFMARFDPEEPHPVIGPFTRWPRASDGVLVVIVFAVSLVTVTASAIGDDEDFTLSAIGDRPLGAVGLLAVAALALWWRRARPIAVAVAVLTITVGWALANYGDGHDVALVVASYSVGRYASDHRHSMATVAALVGVSILGTIIDPNQRVDIVPAILLGGLPWYVGRRIRNRGDYLSLLQDRAERLEAEQHARARQAVADERARIARELHDVVAHQVSMMTVQAGAAKTVARSDLDAAIDAMADAERAGREALGELRHLLGVLRPDSADADRLGPQPRLGGVSALVDELSQTGADVSLTMEELPEAVPTAVELSAYRIVQESVTNIVKHAGTNPVVDISIAVDDGWLLIDIVNTVTASPRETSHPASGYGLVGMRERAALLGGTLRATLERPDRFVIHARLPLEPEPS